MYLSRQLSSVLVALVLILLLWSVAHNTGPYPSAWRFSQQKSLADESVLHFVERLHLRAKEEHADFLTRQSKSYGQAVSNYRKRYAQEPPAGFKTWFNMAQDWSSPVIDDFDDMHQQLRPFRSYLKNGCDEPRLGNDPSSERKLVQLCFEDGEILQYGWREKWYEEALEKMVKDFQHSIPNMCINLNYMDEPRMLLPEGLLRHESVEIGSGHCHPLDFVHLARQNIWSEVAVTCPLDSETRMRSTDTQLNQSYYAEDFDEATDLCGHDRSLAQGLLLSSESLRVSHDIVPVLSGSKLSAFGDVLFPAPFRFESQDKYNPAEDVPWYQKQTRLHWRGSTTGGHATDQSWHQFQRQHLVESLSKKANNAIDVYFTAVTQCDEEACEAQRQFFELKPYTEINENWGYKWILDVDGNGLSGRLYDLLRSGSTVVRQTFMREWHDQRLRPWLHYVPLSSHFEEVNDLLDFLQTPRGDEIARTIADEGRQWVTAAMRQQDMALYFYRLLLEMGRDRRPHD